MLQSPGVEVPAGLSSVDGLAVCTGVLVSNIIPVTGLAPTGLAAGNTLGFAALRSRRRVGVLELPD